MSSDRRRDDMEEVEWSGEKVHSMRIISSEFFVAECPSVANQC